MKKTMLFLVVPLFMVGCSTQSGLTEKQTIAPSDLPKGVIHELDDDTGFHSFHWGGDDNTSLFMIYPHPAGLTHQWVDKMASDMASQVEPELRNMEGVVTLKMETVDISAGKFTGKEILFTLGMSDGETVYQSMYILWDGSCVWQGQMSGQQPKDLEMVRTILDLLNE